MPKNYWRAGAHAFVGLVLIGAGLWLAVLSNPKRFAINVADDRIIQIFALSGFACTIAGIGLFLHAVNHTTKSMPPDRQRNANVGVGLGFVLHLLGFFLPEIFHIPTPIGLAVALAGFPAFVWGAMNYAQGKGYSHWLGLFGLLGILGFIALMVLPPKVGHSATEAY